MPSKPVRPPLLTEQDKKPLMLPPSEGWLTRERVLVLLLAAVTVVAIYLCYLMVLPLLPAITWALAIGVIARPMHVWIARRVHKPNVAAFLSVVAVFLVIVVPGLFIAQQLISEVAAKIQWWQTNIDQNRVMDRLEAMPSFSGVVRSVREHVDLQEEAQRFVRVLTSDLTPVLTGSISAIFQFGVMLFILYFYLRDQRQAAGALRSLVPLSEPETDRIIQRVSDTIHATVNGTVIVGVVQGTLGGLLFWALGVPAPLFWGVIMALASAIPGLSACAVWTPNALILMLQGRWVAGLIVALGAVLVIGLIDNLLLPLVVGKRLRLHVLPTFMAIIGGVGLFGISGIILGPVVLVLMLALVDVWRQRMKGTCGAEAGINAESPAQKEQEEQNDNKVTLDPKKSAVLQEADV